MIDYSYTSLILIIPLLTFIFLGLFGMKFKPIVSGIIGTTGLGITFLLSCLTAWNFFFVNPVHETYQMLIPVEFTWLQFTENLIVKMGILLDPISVMWSGGWCLWFRLRAVPCHRHCYS